jgi:hypothetical protein
MINKITSSDIKTWLAGLNFGASSSQLYIMFLKALFGMAIEDRILINSPAEKLAAPKRSKPIRRTPAWWLR